MAKTSELDRSARVEIISIAAGGVQVMCVGMFVLAGFALGVGLIVAMLMVIQNAVASQDPVGAVFVLIAESLIGFFWALIWCGGPSPLTDIDLLSFAIGAVPAVTAWVLQFLVLHVAGPAWIAQLCFVAMLSTPPVTRYARDSLQEFVR